MACLICDRSDATVNSVGLSGWQWDCPKCGKYKVHKNRDNVFVDAEKRAVASHLVRNLQKDDANYFPELTEEFFAELKHRFLPSPAELMDNFIKWVAKGAQGRPGQKVQLYGLEPSISVLVSEIGGVTPDDVFWVVDSLLGEGVIQRFWSVNGKRMPDEETTIQAASIGVDLFLTAAGWQRFELLKREEKHSKFAFFARKFDNSELDRVFADCLYSAVKSTGYELRTVTQKAGPVDAIIEDEIRRCRFLIADLTDGNNGAYWEAGFAEGLGKPVIYICRDVDKDTGKPIDTHFDTDHRHTVRWNLDTLDETAKRLKAVIRNTLLGDAVLSD